MDRILSEKNLTFRFDGEKYAFFKLDDGEQITDFNYLLDEAVNFAEKV